MFSPSAGKVGHKIDPRLRLELLVGGGPHSLESEVPILFSLFRYGSAAQKYCFFLFSAIVPEPVRSFEHNGCIHCGVCGQGLASRGAGLTKHKREYVRCEESGTLGVNNTLPESLYTPV